MKSMEPSQNVKGIDFDEAEKVHIKVENEGYILDCTYDDAEEQINQVFIKVENKDSLGIKDDTVPTDVHVHEIYIKVEKEEDPLDESEAQVLLDGQTDNTKIMQERKMHPFDDAVDQEMPNCLKNTNCSSVNYLEYHESERLRNAIKQDIKQDPEEVDNWLEERSDGGIGGHSRVNFMNVEVIVDAKEGEDDNEREEYGIKIEEGVYVRCHHCGEKRLTEDELQMHIKNVHLPLSIGKKNADDNDNCKKKRHRCTFCLKEFEYKSRLERHIKIHTGEKSLKCKACDYSTSCSYTLRVHMRKHTGDKPFKCHECNFSTAYSSHLKLHMSKHTGERPHKCNLCDFSTALSSYLKVHLLTHKVEKPYKCNLCDFSTANNSHLKMHIRLHSGNKPYKCNECNFSTAYSRNLKVHMLKHTYEKPYKCSVCDYSTITSSNLKKHIRTHKGKK